MPHLPIPSRIPSRPGRSAQKQTASALLLCALLALQSIPASASPQSASNPTNPALSLIPPQHTRPIAAHLDPDQRILHLLNRFSFGPTPNQIASVRTLGVDKWFEQQLHPDRLPDANLNARLAEFPAMGLPVDQLLAQFPSGAEIRQASNGKLPMPNDPTLGAIYNRHIALYEEKQAKKLDAKTTPQVASTMAPVPGKSADMATNVESAAAAPTKPAQKPEHQTPARPSYADLLATTVLNLPPVDRINRILSMPPREYEDFRASLKGPNKARLTAGLTPDEKELLNDYDNPTRTVIEELQSQRLLRDIYSTHQLQEVMTTFWMNHFNIYIHKNEETPYYLVSYERDVIAPHALGKFEDLLVATSESPAMLIYLDNSSSTGPDSPVAEKQKQHAAFDKIANPKRPNPPGLNENYARELMELHTLGVNGGYTQKDVTEVAKVFTGWTVDHPATGGAFKFDETRHEPGVKLVLNHKIKEDGQKEGLKVLHTLATSPATAKFIARELAVAFVSDNPPPALVDRMAQTFRNTHGDIPSILRTMLHSPEFWSPAIYQTKVKTPLEYIVSAARASNADVTNTKPLINQLNQMGMPLYSCVPPTGYADTADAWISTGELVTRMNFSLSLANNKLQGIQTAWTNQQSTSTNPQQITPEMEEQRLESQLIPTGISEKTRAAVLEQSQPQPPSQPAKAPANAPIPKPVNPTAQAAALERQSASLAGLLLGSPEFQRR
jgi:uncharacterized protein (DUF1800 family)